MAQKRDGPNWKKIKAEYVRGGISQQKLADKYGVSISTIERRARLEKWTELRKAREGKAAEKLVEKTADIQADTAARLMQMQSEAALAIYGKLLANITNYPEGVGTKTMRETVEVKKVTVNGEAREFPLKSAFVNDLEAVVRSMASLARLYGLDAASKMSRERFELQKQQGGGADDTDTFNENILSIAELINHPMPDRTMEQVESSAPEPKPKDGDGA
ncbi:MAG: hypothetical protein IJ646_11285 [Clostridia bacterium]|nr:hypothetical protein [Clostridia bacterium]